MVEGDTIQKTHMAYSGLDSPPQDRVVWLGKVRSTVMKSFSIFQQEGFSC